MTARATTVFDSISRDMTTLAARADRALSAAYKLDVDFRIAGRDLRLDDAISHGNAFWRIDKQGRVQVGKFQYQGNLPGITWYRRDRKEFFEPLPASASSPAQALIHLPDIHPIVDIKRYETSWIRPTRSIGEERVDLLAQLRHAEDPHCYRFFGPRSEISGFGPGEVTLSAGRLFNISREARYIDNDPSWCSKREHENLWPGDAMKRTFRGAAHLADLLRANSTVPTFVIRHPTVECLEMAWLYSRAGWDILAVQEYFSRETLERYLTHGVVSAQANSKIEFCPKAQVEKLHTDWKDAHSQSGHIREDSSPSIPVQNQLAFEYTGNLTRSDLLQIAAIFERCRKEDGDFGIYFSGRTAGELSAAHFAALLQRGSRFVIARHDQKIAAVCIVDEPEVAARSGSDEMLKPGVRGRDSYVQWLVADPDAEVLRGALYKGLIDRLVSEQRAKGAGMIIGHLHPLSVRGFRAHGQVGDFQLTSDFYVSDSIRCRAMVRVLDPSLAVTPSTDDLLTSFSADLKRAIVSYARMRLSVRRRYVELEQVAGATYRRAPREASVARFMNAVRRVYSKSSAEYRALEQETQKLFRNAEDSELVLSRVRRLVARYFEETPRQLERSFRELGAKAEPALNFKVQSRIESDQELLEEFRVTKGEVLRSVEQRLRRFPQLLNCFSWDSDVWFSGHVILLDLLGGARRDQNDYGYRALKERSREHDLFGAELLTRMLKSPEVVARQGVDAAELVGYAHDVARLSGVIEALIRRDLLSQTVGREAAQAFRQCLSPSAMKNSWGI